MAKLTDIEGVGPAYSQKLKKAGVSSTDALLNKGATAKGRQAIADKSGISGKRILRWVNHADLFRLDGVAGEYAELLEAAGVDTVPELAQRNAENLYQKLVEVNEAQKLVRVVPVQTQVGQWVEQAKNLPRIVTH
jgi:predicted flap endonuclease-1-like 5' DNA nuclease